MMKQKICVTIPSLHGAGCERMLSEVLPYYAAEFEVDLLLIENKINYSVPENINIVCLNKSLNVGGALRKIVTISSVLLNLAVFFRRKKYSAIVSYLDNYNVMVYLANLFRFNKPPHIVCEQTTDYEFFENSKMSRRKQNVFKFLVKTAYNRVDRIIAVSQNVKNFLRDELGIKTPITVIHNGVDTKKFNLVLPADKSGIDKDFAEAKVKLLCLSRLDFQKNIMFLLESFNLAKDELKDANLFVLGAGPLQQEVEEKINSLNLTNRVFLLGFRSNPEDYLRLSDVFLLTSRYESFGNVVIEALACGVPVITTNYGAVVREMLVSKDLGEIIPQNDTRAFADAIISVVEHKEKFNRASLNDYARQNFDVSKKATEYLNIIKTLIKG